MYNLVTPVFIYHQRLQEICANHWIVKGNITAKGALVACSHNFSVRLPRGINYARIQDNHAEYCRIKGV